MRFGSWPAATQWISPRSLGELTELRARLSCTGEWGLPFRVLALPLRITPRSLGLPPELGSPAWVQADLRIRVTPRSLGLPLILGAWFVVYPRSDLVPWDWGLARRSLL